MEKLSKKPIIKLVIIAFLTLFSFIPFFMIRSTVKERQEQQENATIEISDKWSRSQLVTGPFICVPYEDYNDADHNYHKRNVYIMPKKLAIKGDVQTQKLHRGIYDAAVYNSDLILTGTFDTEDLGGFNPQKCYFDEAKVQMQISDLRGIENQLQLQWDDETYEFESAGAENGIQVAIDLYDSVKHVYNFSIRLQLKGTQQLKFAPIGDYSEITLRSDWNNPSFDGDFLPSTRNVSDTGFSATWKVQRFNCSYPQIGYAEQYGFNSSTVGVNLNLPVDNYQKTDRCIKYSILFTLVTFIVFFFVEVLKKKLVHPIQYILIGAALFIFYALLLSISEYLTFNLAYVIATLAITLLITLYSKAILHSWKLGGLVGGILFVLYSYLFVVIQLQDYALIAGSIFIFLVLMVIMYSSRKVDWYNLKDEKPSEQ